MINILGKYLKRVIISANIHLIVQQIKPGSLDLINLYMEVTKDPFSYIFINPTQEWLQFEAIGHSRTKSD